MKQEKVTDNYFEKSLSLKGVTDKGRQAKIIKRFFVTNTIAAMLYDVLDSFLQDCNSYMRLLDVEIEQDRKHCLNETKRAYQRFHYYMNGFLKYYFDEKDGELLEDNAQDMYELVKLLIDHADTHEDYEQIKSSVKRRKLNHHIFEE